MVIEGPATFPTTVRGLMLVDITRGVDDASDVLELPSDRRRDTDLAGYFDDGGIRTLSILEAGVQRAAS